MKMTMYPDPILLEECSLVESVPDPTIISDMISIVNRVGGVGLAANQVGLSIGICVVNIPGPRGTKGPLVLVNPSYEFMDLDNMGTSREHCLSLPFSGGVSVRRCLQIQVDYLDPQEMKHHSIVAEGFLARVLQHEIDHLQGITILQRTSKLQRNIAVKKMSKKLHKLGINRK